MRFAELSKEDRVFICEQIPINEAKQHLKNHSRETSEIYKGRVQSLSKERMVSILASNERRPFISDFVDRYLNLHMDMVREITSRLIEKEEMNQQKALAFTLSNSIFASRVSIYLKLVEEDYSEAYCQLLQNYVSMLNEETKTHPSNSDAEEIIEKKALEEKIALLESQKEEAKTKHLAEVQALATEESKLKQELDRRTDELKEVKEKLSTTELKIAEQSRVIDAYQNPPMPPLRYEHRSLCRVDVTGEIIWLIRLADYSGDTLMSCDVDPDRPRIFDNRDRLFPKDGPREDGYIGVWDWRTVPNRTDPEKDYVLSAHCPEITPIEVIIVNYQGDINALTSELQTGVEAEPSVERILFSVYKGSGAYSGVLCSVNDLVFVGGKVRLSERVYRLPLYEFTKQSLIEIENRRYHRKRNLGPEKETITIIEPLDIVKHTLLNRMTWSAAKQQGVLKSDWRTMRDFIKEIESEDYYQSIVEACGCSLAEAHSYTDQFLETVKEHISLEDVDSRLLSFIAMNHPELRKKCMNLLTQQWQEENQESIRRKEEERTAVIDEISALKTDRERLSSEIESFRSELACADDQIQERRQLADDVEKKVAERIAAAKKNAADFICEMAFHAPNTQTVVMESVQRHNEQAMIVPGVELSSEDAEALHSWKEVVDNLCDNLEEAGVMSTFRRGFSAFLYASYCNHFSVLLVGPNGREIADALSATLMGKTADYLDCTHIRYSDASEIIDELDESVLVLDHPLVSDWAGHIPDITRKKNCFPVFVHPYKEDMAVEPAGIANYLVPVFTEWIIDQLPSGVCFPCGIGEGFRRFDAPKTARVHKKLLSRLGVAPIAQGIMQRVLTSMHGMCEDNSADNDATLCLAPMAYLMNQTDYLIEKIEEKDQKKLPMSEKAREYLIELLRSAQ